MLTIEDDDIESTYEPKEYESNAKGKEMMKCEWQYIFRQCTDLYEIL